MQHPWHYRRCRWQHSVCRAPHLFVRLIAVDSLSALRRDLDERISQVRTQLEEVQDLKKKSFSLYKDRKRETLDRLTEACRHLRVSLLFTPCPGAE
jgi:hypothetical protein